MAQGKKGWLSAEILAALSVEATIRLAVQLSAPLSAEPMKITQERGESQPAPPPSPCFRTPQALPQ
ncbi:MAG: hypothetical protein M5U34_09950 [Chloroflexi bacterium]|nr:hypothetical protein [Chloroflexota bacterium]